MLLILTFTDKTKLNKNKAGKEKPFLFFFYYFHFIIGNVMFVREKTKGNKNYENACVISQLEILSKNKYIRQPEKILF